jgi:hypothetical protein
MSETRKIAVILVADVVGYSRLADADEERTRARLRALRRMTAMARTPLLPEATPVGALSAQRRSCWLEERWVAVDPSLPFRISAARPENDGSRPFGFHDHSRLRRVGSLGSGAPSHRAKEIARRHAIGLDEWRTSSQQPPQFVQGSIRL